MTLFDCLLTEYENVASITSFPPRNNSQIGLQLATAQEPASHRQPHGCSASMVESEKAATPLAVDGMRMHHANCSLCHQLWFADCLLFSCFCLLTDDGVASATLSPPRKKSQIAKAQEPASHPQPHDCSTSIVESEKAATPLAVDGMRMHASCML